MLEGSACTTWLGLLSDWAGAVTRATYRPPWQHSSRSSPSISFAVFANAPSSFSQMKVKPTLRIWLSRSLTKTRYSGVPAVPLDRRERYQSLRLRRCVFVDVGLLCA